jgi:hypothetical protein
MPSPVLSSLYFRIKGLLTKSFTFVLILFLPSAILAQFKSVGATGTSPSDILKRLRPFFEQNDGQLAPEVQFFCRGAGYSILLERDGTVVLATADVHADGKLNPVRSSVQLHFIGASATTKFEGKDPLPGKSNYFSGPDSQKWNTRIPHFSEVTYRQIYPGIDLVFYFKDNHVEYDFVLAPGADPGAIRMHVDGAETSLTRSGEIAIASGRKELVRSRKPFAYQRNEHDRLVPVSYALHGREVRFTVGGYDHHKLLVIDPALSFATFVIANCAPGNGLPNCNDDFLADMAADKTGVYIAGFTTASTFPSVAGQSPVPQVRGHGYVVKLDPTGSQILYATFISSLLPQSLALDSAGEVFVSGDASPGFPTTPGAFSASVPSCTICDFPSATKLSSDGSTLLYSTLLMANDLNVTQDDPSPRATAVDSNGNLYVTGEITQQLRAIPLRFPATVGSFQATPASHFLMKLNASGSALVYSTYLPPDDIEDLAVDGNGAAYFTGLASPGYPTTVGSYQPTTTASSAFLTKLSADGSSLVYSTFFGANDVARGVAVDSSGQAVIAGVSNPTPPTTPGALCPGDPGAILQGFITKFNQTGSGLIFSTALCNVNHESTEEVSVDVDSSGAAYVLGMFESGNSAVTFPLLHPIQNYTFQGGNAFTAIKLDSTGAEQWGTFLGSANIPGASNGNRLRPARIRLDGTGAAYVLEEDLAFPTTPKGLQPVDVDPGGPAVFLAKILPSLGAAVPVVSPAAVTFPNPQVTGSSSAPMGLIVGNFGDADMSSTPIISIAGSNFLQTNTCSGPVLAAKKCNINLIFAPTAAGFRAATLTVKIGGFPDQTVTVTGTGTAPVVALSSVSLTFPPEPVSATSPAQTVVVNNNGTGPLNVSSTQVSGDFAQTNTCGGSVNPGSSCSLQITFTPTAQGKRFGTLTLIDNDPAGPARIVLTGFSGQSAGAALAPENLNFPGQIVGTTSSAKTVRITNIGNLPLNLTNIGANGDFSQTNNCTGPVAPGGNCTVQVSFTPTAKGPRNGLLTLTDNSYTSPENVALAGTGSDFTFGVPLSSSVTATITAGQTATYTLTATPVTNAGGTLNFTCNGAPAMSSCTVSPASLMLNNTAQNVTVNVSTIAGGFTAIRRFGAPGRLGALPALALCLLTLLILFTAQGKRVRWRLVPPAVLLFCAGCVGGGGGSGSRSNIGTPTGTFTIVVTATPGTNKGASHSTNLTLKVQ